MTRRRIWRWVVETAITIGLVAVSYLLGYVHAGGQGRQETRPSRAAVELADVPAGMVVLSTADRPGGRRVYHRPSCGHAGRIEPANRVVCTPAQAREQWQAQPCTHCQPPPD